MTVVKVYFQFVVLTYFVESCRFIPMKAFVDNDISMFYSTFVCVKGKVNLFVLIQVAKLSRFIPIKAPAY